MTDHRFFGVGIQFTWVGTSPAIDLTTRYGPNLDQTCSVGSKGTACIHFTADSTFSVLQFENQSAIGSQGDITTLTFKDGTEIVAVSKYTLATGSCIAFHSK